MHYMFIKVARLGKGNKTHVKNCISNSDKWGEARRNEGEVRIDVDK